MCPALLTPPLVAAEAFTDAIAAVGRLEEIYERNTQFLRDHFKAYAGGEELATRVRANYPFVRIHDVDSCAPRFASRFRLRCGAWRSSDQRDATFLGKYPE
jgi:hypothetical protein